MTVDRNLRRGLVLGCGGIIGAAWTVGALVAVEQALQWDVRLVAAMIGTSAGAEFVTMLGSGISVAEIFAAQVGDADARPPLTAHLAAAPGAWPRRPRPRLGSPRLTRAGLRRRVAPLLALSGLLPEGGGDSTWLATLVDALVPDGGWVPHPAAWVVGVDYDTGERVAFGAPGAPTVALRDAVRASWAIPAWFPPVSIAGRRFIDGGMASPTSADLLLPLGLDEVVVLAPMASLDPGRPSGVMGHIERLLRNAMSRRLDAEVAILRATGIRVLRVDPGAADLTVMGPNIMDGRRRLATLETSLRTSKATVARALAHQSFASSADAGTPMPEQKTAAR